ncbi:MAG: phosphatase PAP2 family protein [Sphingomonas bacterium]|nr:phosphatase PAP2 family protein [Sphingomonas bacterium]
MALLFSLCLAAGIIGGIDFPPDVALIRHLETARAVSPGLTLAAIAITQAGSAYGTIGGGLAVTAWLAWRGQRWLAAVLGATVIGERFVVDGMKLLIDRTRPSFDLHPVVTHSSSFPSGHAGNSMAVLLAIALIAVPRAHRLPAVLGAVAFSLLVGATRPYLGVHWPSDVIGGWSLGAGLAIIAWSIAEARGSASAQQ